MQQIMSTKMCQFTRVLQLLLLFLVLLEVGALPMLSSSIRRHIQHKHDHNIRHMQHQHHKNLPEEQRPMPNQSRLDTLKQALNIGDEEHDDVQKPQVVEMHAVNAWSGYRNWIDAETHSVYMFTFTYFGMITLLMVMLLVLMSCCYMYDCMGCYDPFVQKCNNAAGAGASSSVFPSAKDSNKLQMVLSKDKKSSSSSSSSRRWSSATIVQL
uniref:Uncharacterized protein n=1 Tax=Globodera rostochiensis TaxID=31243 RepID=A0A914I5M3_GLORO